VLQSIPKGFKVIVAKATRVAYTTVKRLAIKGHPKGLDDFLFIVSIVHLGASAGGTLIPEDCCWGGMLKYISKTL